MNSEDQKKIRQSRQFVINNEPVELLVRNKLRRPTRMGSFIVQERDDLETPIPKVFEAGTRFYCSRNPEWRPEEIWVSTTDETAWAYFTPDEFGSLFDWPTPVQRPAKEGK